MFFYVHLFEYEDITIPSGIKLGVVDSNSIDGALVDAQYLDVWFRSLESCWNRVFLSQFFQIFSYCFLNPQFLNLEEDIINFLYNYLLYYPKS